MAMRQPSSMSRTVEVAHFGFGFYDVRRRQYFDHRGAQAAKLRKVEKRPRALGNRGAPSTRPIGASWRISAVV